MTIIDWTSEGMDWDNPKFIESKYISALSKATLEYCNFIGCGVPKIIQENAFLYDLDRFAPFKDLMHSQYDNTNIYKTFPMPGVEGTISGVDRIYYAPEQYYYNRVTYYQKFSEKENTDYMLGQISYSVQGPSDSSFRYDGEKIQLELGINDRSELTKTWEGKGIWLLPSTFPASEIYGTTKKYFSLLKHAWSRRYLYSQPGRFKWGATSGSGDFSGAIADAEARGWVYGPYIYINPNFNHYLGNWGAGGWTGAVPGGYKTEVWIDEPDYWVFDLAFGYREHTLDVLWTPNYINSGTWYPFGGEHNKFQRSQVTLTPHDQGTVITGSSLFPTISAYPTSTMDANINNVDGYAYLDASTVLKFV